MKTLTTIAAAFVTVSVLWGGYAAAQQSTAMKTSTQKKDADPAAMARGAQAWAQYCGSCHNARDPKDMSDLRWKITMSHMRIRAGLTGQEARDILKFLQASN